MGAPSWTSFCANGHIVESCAPHEIIDRELEQCICGAKAIGTVIEWGDDDDDYDYGPSPVPTQPLRYETIKTMVECEHCHKQTTAYETNQAVYDVSKLIDHNRS